MKSLRRKRLNDLLNSPRFNGSRSDFLASSGLSKGRLTQLLNPEEPFGDAAARNLCEALGLPSGWFESVDIATAIAVQLSAPAAPPSPFLTAQDRRRPLPLAELLAQLAVLLDAVDAPTRDNAALMLSSFANKPEGRASSTSSLVSMLEPDALKKDTPAQQPQSMSSGAR